MQDENEYRERHKATVVAGVQNDGDGEPMVMLKMSCQGCNNGEEYIIGPFPAKHLGTLAKVADDMAKKIGLTEIMTDNGLVSTDGGWTDSSQGLEETIRGYDVSNRPPDAGWKVWGKQTRH